MVWEQAELALVLERVELALVLERVELALALERVEFPALELVVVLQVDCQEMVFPVVDHDLV